MGVSKNRGGPPKSSMFIGFSIIFTIHFGGKIPLLLETPIFLAHLSGDRLVPLDSSKMSVFFGGGFTNVGPFPKGCHVFSFRTFQD